MKKYLVKSKFNHLGETLYSKGSIFETEDEKLALSLIKSGLLYDPSIKSVNSVISGGVEKLNGFDGNMLGDKDLSSSVDGVDVVNSTGDVELDVDVESAVEGVHGSAEEGSVESDEVVVVSVPVADTGSVDLGDIDNSAPDFDKMSKADLISWARSNKISLSTTVDSKKADIVDEILSKLG